MRGTFYAKTSPPTRMSSFYNACLLACLIEIKRYARACSEYTNVFNAEVSIYNFFYYVPTIYYTANMKLYIYIYISLSQLLHYLYVQIIGKRIDFFTLVS